MSNLDAVFKSVREDYMSSFVPPNTCQDQYVADVAGLAGSVNFIRRPVDEQPSGQAPIVLVIESPHVDEFADPAHPVPANGTTGDNIRHRLTRVIAMVPDAAAITFPRPLVLMNAVQYQCSLGGLQGKGISTNHHRDAVFSRMWSIEDVRADFQQRLRQYVGHHQPFSDNHRSGVIVINACTMGPRKHAEQLRVKVEDQAIVPILGRSSHLHVRHPSFWLPNKHISQW